MDAVILESYLRRDLSLQAIGQLTGRDPTTVGYWVKRHGLAAVHKDRHAPKGGIERERLSELVADGLTTREISLRLGLSQSTVRYWLRRHELKTVRARRSDTHGRRGIDPDRRTMECGRHGATEFWLEGRGIYRCLRCRSESVARRRKRLKEELVAAAGGRCGICGYDRCIGALHFHHRDGQSKEFGLSERGFTKSIDAMKAEAAKCILLCANCHSEVEAGIVSVA